MICVILEFNEFKLITRGRGDNFQGGPSLYFYYLFTVYYMVYVLQLRDFHAEFYQY